MANLLEGKVAIVTGASRGIGKATALAFAREGADVVVTARNPAPLVEVAEEIHRMGRKTLLVAMDVTSEEDADRMARESVVGFGGIDILFNSAGTTGLVSMPAWETTVAEWDRVMDANVRGTFLCCRAVLSHMVHRHKGNIVNMASIAGRTSKVLSNRGAYSASKAAVLGYTSCLAKSVRPYGIRVNAISPGPVDTGLIDRGDVPHFTERWTTPEEIADVAMFLVTAAPGDMTGQSIDVFGSGHITT